MFSTYFTKLTQDAFIRPPRQTCDISMDYKALYGDEDVIREYVKENKEISEKFQKQFGSLLVSLKKWGENNSCYVPVLVNKIDKCKTTFFESYYSGNQTAHFFNIIKLNLENLWFILTLNQDIPRSKKQNLFKQLCGSFDVCAPGLYTHIEDTLNTFTTSISLEQSLAELRTNIIKKLADDHNYAYRVKGGDDVHTYNAFLIYANNEGWAPLSDLDKTIDPFAAVHTRIDEKVILKFSKDFEELYSPAAIVECVKTNFCLEMNKIKNSLGIKEDKSGWMPSSPEFLKKLIALSQVFGLQEKDFVFFDLATDGKSILFNGDMFEAAFIRFCQREGKLFNPIFWQVIILENGYQFHYFDNQLSWQETSEKELTYLFHGCAGENVLLLKAAELSAYLKNEKEFNDFCICLKGYNYGRYFVRLLYFLHQKELLSIESFTLSCTIFQKVGVKYDTFYPRIFEAYLNLLQRYDEAKILDEYIFTVISEIQISNLYNGGHGYYLNCYRDLAAFPLHNTLELMIINPEKYTPLFRYFVQKGLDINCKSPVGATSLLTQMSKFESNFETIKMMLELGADPKITDMEGRSVLSGSVFYNANTEIVELLLKHGANPNSGNLRCGFASQVIVDKMLCHYRSFRDSELYNTAIPQLKLLLEYKANPSVIVTKDKETLLHLLCDINLEHEQVCLDTIQLLLTFKADTNAQNKLGETPLHIAYKFNHTKVVDLLLSSGADPTLKNKNDGVYQDRSLAIITVEKEIKRIRNNINFLYRKLINFGAHLHSCEDFPADESTSYSVLLEIQQLLKLEKTVGFSDKFIESAEQQVLWLRSLVAQIENYNYEKLFPVFSILINLVDIKKFPTLLYTACDGKFPVCLDLLKFLLKLYVNINEKNNYKYINAIRPYELTILHAFLTTYRIDRPRVEALKLILEAKADPNIPFGPEASSVLHWVSRCATSEYSFVDCLEVLIQYKANLSAVDIKQNTALHYAYQVGDENVISFLLRHGANTSLKNTSGKLPSEMLLSDDACLFALTRDHFQWYVCRRDEPMRTLYLKIFPLLKDSIPTVMHGKYLESIIKDDQFKVFICKHEARFLSLFERPKNLFLWNILVCLLRTKLLTAANIERVFTGFYKWDDYKNHRLSKACDVINESFFRQLEKELSDLFKADQLTQQALDDFVKDFSAKFDFAAVEEKFFIDHGVRLPMHLKEPESKPAEQKEPAAVEISSHPNGLFSVVLLEEKEVKEVKEVKEHKGQDDLKMKPCVWHY